MWTRSKSIKDEKQEHRVGQKTRLDYACHSTWTTIFSVNKLVIILFIYLTLPHWTTFSNALPTSYNNSNSSLSVITNVPTNKQQIRLFCRVGRFLSMDDNGTISGGLRKNNTRVIFELQSFGPSIVRIKHKVTGLFITMNSKGKVKGKRNAIFKDYYFYLHHEENAFVSFASYYHKRKKMFEMFLGIKRGGEVKNGKQTYSGQDSVQFLLI